MPILDNGAAPEYTRREDPPLTMRRLSILILSTLLALCVAVSAAIATWAGVKATTGPTIAMVIAGVTGVSAFALTFMTAADVLRRWIR